ncbi:hydroxypyruvate isomerase family protein [Salegentibacter salegens]|uniref:Hydroxypyruvate isomerase n=1 Tax=Salegentibacter salegens TaxID=143223 RepID=A0A1M7NY18_9FLAO|nr:TIM barrel protein [Salegentibacter salegens]PRX46405.1 hydroxypyruvate isomerase [Salegentibacter salegens]SHN09037.1 hydroxypyruvate isomerase [Salegentibacter salegens]
MDKKFTRRNALKSIAIGSGILSLGGVASSFAAMNYIDNNTLPNRKKNNIKHSVCRWCFQDIPLDEFAKTCANMGIQAIDLLKPSEWDTVEKYGLVCSMATDDFANIENGFNEPKNHKDLQERYKGLIDKAAKHNIKNVIVFSGNRRGMDEQTGIKNCSRGLKPLLKYAKKKNITLVMELLNSKVNHPDYMADHTEWGVALAVEMGVENFKLLYDIYHMQVMEGDIIATIKKHHKHINHYHTAGVPGRNEIDDSQELFYPAIMKAIVETGFEGFVAQEFIPTNPDEIASLKKAIEICDV